jgi:hypothetical protein
MSTHPVLDLDLVKSVLDLPELARTIVLADVTVWVAEHGGLAVEDLRRFIAEAQAVSA